MFPKYSLFDEFFYFYGTLAVIITIFVLGLSIAFYILKSLGLMTMAKDKKIANPWLAWIPIGDAYIVGSIIKKIGFHFDTQKYLKLKSIINLQLSFTISNGPIAAICIIILMGISRIIPIIGQPLYYICLFLLLVILYNLYKLIHENRALLYTLLSLIIFPSIPVLLFLYRHAFKTDNITPSDPPESQISLE